jgi:hypothetical protein
MMKGLLIALWQTDVSAVQRHICESVYLQGRELQTVDSDAKVTVEYWTL